MSKIRRSKPVVSAVGALTPAYSKPATEDSIVRWEMFAAEQQRMQKHVRSLTDQIHQLRKKLHEVTKKLKFKENAAQLKGGPRG